MDYQLGIVGAGNMAEAIVRGVLRAKRLPPTEMAAADPSEQRRALFSNELGIATFTDAVQFAPRCHTLLLSVKPQQMATALAALGPSLNEDTLIISIAAGISSGFISKALGNRAAWRVVRSMPNTPMLVGEGMVALSAGNAATAKDLETARQLFEAAATVVEVPESLMDAVTAVSGSGPAYVFYLVEQMIAAGTELGLSPETSRMLATRTALGAAKMLSDSPDSPAELRRKVTSPGGTTAAAISVMEQRDFAQVVRDAVTAAQRRGREIGQ